MSIRSFFKMKPAGNLVIVGEPVETNILDSNGRPYYSCKLLNPVTARCSYNKDITPVETEEIFIREAALDEEQAFLNPDKPEEGWTIKDWVVDFSTGQEIVVYQKETIAQWARNNRGTRKETHNADVNKRIADKMLKRGAKSDTPPADK